MSKGVRDLSLSPRKSCFVTPGKIPNVGISSPVTLMLGTTIEFIIPAFIDAKKGCIDFQDAAAGRISAFDLETIAIVWTAGDIEDHGVVEGGWSRQSEGCGLRRFG